jgi:hypothetical protein
VPASRSSNFPSSLSPGRDCRAPRQRPLLHSPLRPRGAVRRMRRGAGVSPVAAALTASGARRCCASRWRQRAEPRWRHPLAVPRPILWRHHGPSSPVVEQRRRVACAVLPATAGGEPLLPPS